jgi:hypothetical protein
MGVSFHLAAARAFRSSRLSRAAFAIALLCMACDESCSCSSRTSSGSTMPALSPSVASSEERQPVSLVRLIGQPEAFRGERVQVIGFVSIEREGTAIYLHKEDFLQGIAPNGIWLDLERAKVPTPRQSGYAIVEGRFDPTVHGHLGLFPGGIYEIDRVTPLPSRADFAPPPTHPALPPIDAGPSGNAPPR